MIHGYCIAREYRLLTVYKFTDEAVLMSVARFKPVARLPRERRWQLICDQIQSHGILPPQYYPPAPKGARPRTSEEFRTKWIAEHLDEFPLGDISSSRRQRLIERMKQAGLFAPSTYWRDAWKSVQRALKEIRK